MHVSLARQIEGSRLYVQKGVKPNFIAVKSKVLGFTAYLWCKAGIAENHQKYGLETPAFR